MEKHKYPQTNTTREDGTSSVKVVKYLRENSRMEEGLFTTLHAVYKFYLRGYSFVPISKDVSDMQKFLPEGENQIRPPLVFALYD